MTLRRRSDPGHGSGPPRYPGTFLLALQEAASTLNWQIRRWLGEAVECTDADGKEHVVGLENLYRRARRIERSQWPAFIVEFLRCADTANIEHDLPEDLQSVADQLLVRLGLPFSGPAEQVKAWSQPLDGTPLCLNLVIDFPHRMFYVPQELVEESGRPGPEWLAQALANLRARTPANCFTTVHEETGLLMCAVGDAYDSSRALMLDELLPESRADGCFVAIPGRDLLLVLPVDAESLGCIHLLKLLAEHNYKTTPYAISDQVFWVRQSCWRHFGIQVQGEKITIQPPEDFLEVMERLLPDEEDEDETPS
jgi:hypothetical protein